MREDLLAESERIGRAMFGSALKFRLGIWIASLPGAPRTFSALEWWEFCRQSGWPGDRKPIVPMMARFETCGMIVRRNDLRPRAWPRNILWTKVPSDAWGFFEALDPWLRMGEPKLRLADLQSRLAVHDLKVLVEELR